MYKVVVVVAVVGIVGALYMRSRQVAQVDAAPQADLHDAAGQGTPGPSAADDLKLIEAATNGDAAGVATLLQQGADPTVRDSEWATPLGVAIVNGHEDVVRALIAAGVDPNAPARGDDPALFLAAAYSQPAVLQSLIDARAALDYSNSKIGSPLSIAVLNNNRETAEALLSAGASIDLLGPGGVRPLHYAAYVGNVALTKWLVSKGSDVRLPNFQGGTPLRSAAEQGHAEIVAFLLEAGASASSLDAFDKHPIDYAREAGHDHVVDLLEADKSLAAQMSEPWPTTASLVSTLPARSDASLQVVRHSIDKGYGTAGETATSSIEAPSVIALLQSIAPNHKILGALNDSPDPRLPAHAVDFMLWSYEESGELTERAHKAVGRPSATFVDLVARVAEYPYQLDVWSRAAATTAEQLAPSDLTNILAVAVFPPDGPRYIEPWDWYFRVQVAAALIASHLVESPWVDSPGRHALEAVLSGPADWTNTAAIIALFDVARRDKVARPLVLKTLLRTARRPITPPVYQHAIMPAAFAILELGDISPEVSDEMTSLIKVTSTRDTRID